MESKKTKGIIVFLVLLICVISVSVVSAGVSDAGIEYDSELLGQFLISDRVYVMVKIHDNTNITIPKKDSPDFESRINERTSILSRINDAVVSSLSEDEFRLEGKFMNGNGFYGDITKEGFEKLLKDTNVRKIYAKKYLHESGSSILKSGLFILKNIFIYFIPILGIIILVSLLVKLKKRRWKVKKLKG